ncbi:cytosine permease [Dactylosporangium fulvum]|uniref:Cytosine permease n=1 Tax=Dactylosporangium fulvum TaxID=53359 RepID=A0ABY5W1F9_9ACTN|nr:cytosine permease [Dactylosporangium fulvum]UWP83367.1 cytosine permease [Dactylosporangium fulvum]
MPTDNQIIDMNRGPRSELVESASIEWIPLDLRKGNAWSITPFFFVANWSFFTIALGFTGPSLGLSLGWTLVAGVAGMVFGTFFMAFHATQGPHMGLPQIIQSRAQFGFYGASTALFMAVACYMGFGVVYTVLTTGGLHSLFGWSPLLVGVVINVGAAALAVLGHHALHQLSRIIFYISLPLFVAFSAMIVLGHVTAPHGSGPVGSTGFTASAFVTQFAVAAAYNIALAPIVSDYTRYLPETTRPGLLVAAVYTGTGLSATWLMAIGAWLASKFGADDALTSLAHAGDSVFSGFGVILALVSVATLVVCLGSFSYSVALQVLTAADMFGVRGGKRGRLWIGLAAVAIWSAIAIPFGDNVVGVAGGALSSMLFLLVPWTAVNLTDYFLVRKGSYSIADILDKNGRYGLWSVRGLVAYGAGFAFMVPFAVLPYFHGPIANLINGIDVSFLVGLVVAAATYYLWPARQQQPRSAPVVPAATTVSANGPGHHDDRPTRAAV